MSDISKNPLTFTLIGGSGGYSFIRSNLIYNPSFNYQYSNVSETPYVTIVDSSGTTLLSNHTGNLQNDTLVKGNYKVFNSTNNTLMPYIQENNVNNNQLIKIFKRNVLY